MANWRTVLDNIRRVQTEIQWLRPAGGAGLRLNPPASARSIRVAEQRVRRPLPPSYRAFLAESDGVANIYDGAALFGTQRLGHRIYGSLLDAVCDRAETPVPDIGPPVRRTQPKSVLIPFGADSGANTLFAFNPNVVGADGEYEVICWVNEIGLRRESFTDFLQLLLELSEDQLGALLAVYEAA